MYALRLLGAFVVSVALIGCLFLLVGRVTSYSQAEDVASGFQGIFEVFRPDKEISEAELLAYARTDVDLELSRQEPVPLGRLNGWEVVAEHPCGGVCPDYTERIIRYELPRGRICDGAGGVEREVSIGGYPQVFCFPKVLAENWDTYRRNNRTDGLSTR
jgi:hypothetical protein